jgi:hypothetical protein
LVEGGVNEFTNKIMNLAADKNSIQQTGIQAKKLLNEKFSVEVMGKKYKDLYLNLSIRK